MSKPTAISLFSGMGGDSLGMKQAGVEILAYSEKESVFRETHDANFPNCKLLGKKVKSDILKISDDEFSAYAGKVNMLFAGFPCQSFSTGGLRKVDDPRNTMFREFVRAARLIKPDVVIGENVKGLLTKKTKDGELYIDIIKAEFESLGYDVIYKVLQCHKYGIPQKRERLIILGIKTNLIAEGKYNLEFPQETTPNKKDWVGLRDILEFDMEGTLNVSKNDFDFDTIPDECIMTDMDNEDGEKNPHPYLKMKQDPPSLSYQGKTFTSLFSFAKRDSPIHCEVVDYRNPSKTIICSYDHQPRFFVPVRNKKGDYLRMFTVNELKQIQGFPADFIVKGNQKKQIVQVGNAVPPPLIEAVIKAILVE
jgi:DNA (cytosine-5)-methyltransferase 1